MGKLRYVWQPSFAFFLLLTAYYILKPLRNGLFLSQLGAEKLPLYYLLVALGALGISVIHQFVSQKMAPRPLLSLYIAVSLACLLIFTGAFGQKREIAGVFFIWLSLYNLLSISVFWSFCHSFLEEKNTGFSFPWIGLGGVLGGITGSLLTEHLVSNFGVGPYLFWIAIFLLIFSGLTMSPLVPENAAELTPNQVFSEPDPKPGSGTKILISAGAMVFVAVFAATLLDYQHSIAVKNIYTSKEDITRYFSQFFLRVNLSALIFQAVITPLVFRFSKGIGGLIVLPAASLCAVILYPIGLVPFSWSLAIATGAAYSINQTSKEKLMSLLSFHEKFRLKAILDVFFFRFGDGIAAIVLALSAGSHQTLLFTALFFWFFLVINLWFWSKKAGRIRHA